MATKGRVGRLVRHALSRSKGRLAEALFSSLFVNVLALAVPIFMLQVYDRVVFHAGLTTLQGLVIGMAAAILFDGLLRLGRARLFQRIGLDIDIDVGRSLFEKIVKLPMRVLESRSSTSWQILFRDIDAVRAALSGPAMGLLMDLPFAVLFLCAILWLAPPLAAVILVALPLFILLAWRSGATAANLSEDERSESAKREALINEIVAARATVKSLALAERLRPVWEARHADSIQASLRRGTAGDAHMTLSHVMSLATTVSMTCVGALLILEQSMTIGALIASNMLGARMVAPIAGLVGQWKTLQNARDAARRLDEVLHLEEEGNIPALPFGRPKGIFKLEEVVFRYGREGDAAIDKIDGTIGPNGLHCVVGKNGSGKTTLFKILAGLYPPESGRILLDGADIAQFPRRQLARWIGYMPQEVVMFTGSIRENIVMGDEGGTDEDAVEAAKRAGAHDAIALLPEGYETECGESGGRLSGGQKRRISAARTLIGDPPVLLLDEPSGDLDGEAEVALARNLREMAKDHTILISTHSPTLLSVADTILVLEKGRVAMAGSAKEVMTHLSGGRAQGAQPAQPAQSARPAGGGARAAE
ncbi:MAG: peptidase domain-containing ABC transporter [Pseudomonadota bacterium]|nr:peptidase domain-containing ABC transporter [Pseudomonadota bacterium]